MTNKTMNKSKAELHLEAFNLAHDLHQKGHTVAVVTSDGHSIVDCKTLENRDEAIRVIKELPKGGTIWLCLDEQGEIRAYDEDGQ